MIKQIRASYFANFKNAQYCALSTDLIPDYLENGDKVYMIDTGKNYFWDAISSDLYEDKRGRGDGDYTIYENLINTGTYTISTNDLESGQWSWSRKDDNVARARTKFLIPVYNGMSISYENTTFDVYFGVLETPTSMTYLPGLSGWKTNSSGVFNITNDGYLTFIIRNHTDTTAVVNPADFDSTVIIHTQIKSAVDAEFASIDADIKEIDESLDAKATVIISQASGNIAEFADGADNMPIKHLVANIEAIQEGSGDPSPTNVRQIIGRTGLVGKRTGKNMLMPSSISQSTNNGVTFTYNSDGSITINGATSDAQSTSKDAIGFRLPPGTYKKPSTFVTGVGLIIQSKESSTSWPVVSGGTSASDTFVITEENAKYDIAARIYVYPTAGTLTDYTVYPYIYLASETDLTYEPYVSQNISVNWQNTAGTVYGGTLDVISGRMVVDTKIIQGNEIYVSHYGQPGPGIYQAVINTPDKSATDTYSISNIYHKVDGSPIVSGTFAIISTGITICDSRFDSEETAQSILQSEAQFVYKLATPIEYQLTPQEVTTLLGNNAVWTDAGPVTVDYPADTTIVVSDLKNAIEQNVESIADTQSMIATVEATTTASKNYSVGDLLVYDGKLYKVTSAIATGATIIAGSNVTQTTVETQIASASGGEGDWVKIKDDTLAEAVATHTINTDSNGNPFVLKDAIVYIIATAGSAQIGYLTLSNTNGSNTQVAVGNIVNTGVVRTVIRCERIFDKWNIMMNTPTSNYRDIDKSNQQMFCGLINAVAPVNIVKITLQTTSFPAGTQFMVYGRYAN